MSDGNALISSLENLAYDLTGNGYVKTTAKRALDEIAALRDQIAERDAEIERLQKRISDGVQTFNEIARG